MIACASTGRRRPGSRARRRAGTWAPGAALLAALLASRPAAAQGLDALEADAPGVRGIGRAGAVLVSDDTGAGLLLNPGGLVRREVARMQLGVSIHDHDLGYRPAGQAGDAPRIEDRGAPGRMPILAVQIPLGPVVAGVALLETGERTRVLPDPGTDPPVPGGDVAALFPHRYAGTALSYRRQVLGAGAAVRAGSWLGLGASVTLSRVHLDERRHIWAGLAGSDPLADPRWDVAVTVAGDGVVPGVSAGALIAPPTLPVELAVAASYGMGARLRGPANAETAAGSIISRVVLVDPASRARIPDTLVLRAGARYLGERVLLEAGGEVTTHLGAPSLWYLDGVRIRHESGASSSLTEVPSLLDHRPHGALRIAGDVEVVAGFLWLTGGYAYRTGASRPARATPVHVALAGHTLAAGAEAHWSGITLTLGYARTLARSVEVSATERVWIEPFGNSGVPVGQGRYRSAADVFGAAVEIAWER